MTCDIEAAIKAVRAGLVAAIEAADRDKLVRIADAITRIEAGPEPAEMTAALREEAGRRR